jgi:hypothetical protein
MLSSISSIRRLELSVDIVLDKPSPGPRALTFPHLHTLTFGKKTTSPGESYELVAERWCMPNLRHICGVGEVVRWPQCFDAPSVTSLTYTGSFYSPSILSACPKLEEATFRLWDIVWMPVPVPLRRVNIVFSTSSNLHDHFVSLNNPVTYPKLEVISIITMFDLSKTKILPGKSEEWEGIVPWTFWSYWCRRWKSRSIRLEDASGNPVVLPDNTKFGPSTDEDYYLWHTKITMPYDNESSSSDSDE